MKKEKQCKIIQLDVQDGQLPKFQVIDNSDNFRRSEATTPKGAVLGALACGVQIYNIDFNGFKVGYIKQ